ncbi:hypothetical protein Nepgr_018401 [Nepenthes gracilis]|uniref:Uncharacterized protein n=1 Tax=Nepenthes gracilis TaxID=150966 RepID=A0AAD3XU88_NEPGR|nr:hypothetical protein Nepgr_018401 [Nepenthes gracilis]
MTSSGCRVTVSIEESATEQQKQQGGGGGGGEFTVQSAVLVLADHASRIVPVQVSPIKIIGLDEAIQIHACYQIDHKYCNFSLLRTG